MDLTHYKESCNSMAVNCTTVVSVGHWTMSSFKNWTKIGLDHWTYSILVPIFLQIVHFFVGQWTSPVLQLDQLEYVQLDRPIL